MVRKTSRMLSVPGLALLIGAGLAACTNSEPSGMSAQLGLSCVDDSSHCITQREMVFNQYMADGSHNWIKQPATPEAYASGVRLFALTKKRKVLTCDELRHGKREADAGPSVLRSQSGGRLTPAQVGRGVMLAGEVARDLGREIDKRCKKT